MPKRKIKRPNRSGRSDATCMTCMNCIPIREGDHICDEADDEGDVLVLEDYEPAEGYMWCEGARYIER